MLEIGGGHDHHQGEGDIFVGQRRPDFDDDHLSGFYSVDFDDFSTGDARPKKQIGNDDQLEKSPKKLSVHVSGLQGTDTRELAQLFKDGKIEGHKAYISRPNDEVPSGFNKVTLPFLDPSKADHYKDNLPPVFIAPVGYKVPAGYKGHPLPYDPESVDRLTPSKVVHSTEGSVSGNDIDGLGTTKNPFLINRNKPQVPKKTSTTQAPVTELVEDVQPAEEEKPDNRPSSLFDAPQDPSSIVLNKLKLARNRPSLTTFFNKTRTQQTLDQANEEEQEVVKSNGNKKRKRVLTKVVRKPYNPETTTPSPTVPLEYKTTVVRLVNPSAEDELVEFQTRANPGITTSLPEQEETTEAHVWTTVRPEEPETEVEATTVQPNVVVLDDVKIDASAEPSELVQNFVTTTPVPTTFAQETTTTTTATTTTTVSTINAYEPTPAHPDHRLDKFRAKNRKPAQKIFSSFPANDAEDVRASEEEVSTSPASTPGTTGTTGTTSADRSYGLVRNRLNLRKYGINTQPANSFEANSAANVYGQRIRARKRPNPWTQGYDEEDYQVGATPETTQSSLQTTKKSKAEQYKKKFRPFFDQLYDQLTSGNEKQEEEEEGEEVDEDGEPVRGWARRSTTTPNPFTINAEIYEVHPDSRERITTTKSTTTTTTFVPPTTTVQVEQSSDYEAGSRVDDQPEEELEYVDTNNPPPLEFVEHKLKNLDSTEHPLAQFDIAFKPSQLEQEQVVPNEAEPQRVDDDWNAISVPPEIPASPVEQPEEDEADHEMVASLFSDDMHRVRVPEQPAENVGGFIHFQPQLTAEPEIDQQQQEQKQQQVQPSRLHDYEKNIQPQLQHWTEEHFEPGQGRQPVLNEHTQQHMHVSEGDFIPFQPRDPEGPRPAYVEIQRKPVPHHDDVDDIFNVVDQAYQLEDVQAPAADVHPHEEATERIEDEATERYEDATTQTVFVTRPTTTVQVVTERVEDAAEVNLTTEQPEHHEDEEIEPQPEGPIVHDDDDEHEASTQHQDIFEVTTFRPKVTGGFFDNFNLGNILGYILPTTTAATPAPTIVPEDTTVEVAETTVRTLVETEQVAADESVEKQEDQQEVEQKVVVDPGVEEQVAHIEYEVEEEFVAATETTVSEIEVEPTAEVIPEVEQHQEEVKPVAAAEEEVAEQVQVDVQPDADVAVDTAAVDVTTQEPDVVVEQQPVRIGRPKAIAQPAEDENNVGNELTNDSEAAKASNNTSNISKSVYGAIKREEYLKNWVANRKYPNKLTEAGNKHGVILEGTVDDDASDESAAVLPFMPTVLPNFNRDDASEWETSGVAVKAKRRKVNPLLDKLSSSRKSLKDSLFAKSSSTTTTTTSTSSSSSSSSESSSKAPLYPLGSDTKIFKQWQGDSLSQAEFERTVLGVSTATEVSVKSVICVRGRCYNADNVPSFVGH